MSAVLEAREPSARYLEAVPPTLVRQFDLLATAQGGAGRLRELIVLLALQGRLVEQDPQEASGLDWLATIQARRDTLSAKGLVKPGKNLSPVEENERWFDLPATWTWTRLDDLVVSSEAGWSPSCPETPRRGESWGVLKVSAVSWGKFDPAANKELPDELTPRPEYEVRPGDFLLSRANTAELVARSVVVDEAPPRLMLSDKIIRLTFAEGVNRAFINLCNNSRAARSYYVAKASGTSSSMKNVSREVVLGLPIPVPPVDEQARIVTRVDELMRLCDALEDKDRLEAEQHARLLGTLLGTLTDSSTPEELAANWQRVADHFDLLLDRPEAVDALEQTILQLAVRGLLVQQDPSEEPATVLMEQIRAARAGRLVDASRRKASAELPEVEQDEWPFEPPPGWVWTRFGEVTQVSGGVTLGRKGAIASPVSRPYLRVANVQRWKLALDSMKDIAIDEAELPRYQLAEGDLLITEGGDWDKVGRTAIWRSELPKCLHQNHVFKARGYTTTWNPSWAELYLNLDVARAYFAASAKQTTNLASINMTELRHCVFPLPPLNEQARIVTRVTELRRVCAELRQRLAASQATQAHLAQAMVDEVA